LTHLARFVINEEASAMCRRPFFPFSSAVPRVATGSEAVSRAKPREIARIKEAFSPPLIGISSARFSYTIKYSYLRGPEGTRKSILPFQRTLEREDCCSVKAADAAE
jgi:hypothetical protein